MSETLEQMQEGFGFSGVAPSPLSPQFSERQVRLAAKKQKEEAKGFFELTGQTLFTQSTGAAGIRFFGDDFVDNRPFSQDVFKEITDGITDETALEKILEAGSKKGTGAAKKMIHEMGLTSQLYQDMSAAGMTGTTAYITAMTLDPVDTAAAVATAAAVSAAAPPLAPITAPVTATAVKGYRMFQKIRKAPVALGFGLGATEQAGLELLRSQTVHDITGGDVLLAMAVGGGVTGGFTMYGQYMRKRQAFLEIQRDKAQGVPLSAEKEAFLRQYSDDIITENFTRIVDEADEFNVSSTPTDADFDSDSLIAGLGRKDFTDMSPEELEAVSKQRGKFSSVRGYVSSIVKLKNSEDPVLRWLGDGLALDSLGNKSGKEVGSNALDLRDTLVSTTILKDATRLSNLYDTAAKKLDVSETDIEFMVGEFMRNPNANVIDEVKEISSLYRVNMDKMLRTTIESNAAGFFPDLLASGIENYLPRLVNRGQVALLRFGDKKIGAKLSDVDGDLNPAFFELSEAFIRGGQRNLDANVKKALTEKGLSATDEAVQAFIKRMSQGYIRGLLSPSNNNVRKLGDGVAGNDEALAALKTVGFSEEDASIIVDVLSQTKKVKGHPRALHRMQGDETVEILATADDGSVFTLKFTDLLETNGRNLYEKYLFQTAGAASLAVNGIDTNNVGSAFQTILSKAKGGGDVDAFASDIKAAEFLYDSVKGRLAYREDLSYGTRRWANRLREVSFAANMGMAGMSAIMELSNVVFETSTGTLMKTVPQFNKLIMDTSTGQLKNRAAHEMLVFTGTGGDGLMNKVTSVRSRTEGSIFEEYGTLQGEITKTDEFLGKARIFVSIASGLQGVTDMLRRLSMYNFATEWQTKASQGKLPFSRIKREQMGINDEMGVAINKQITKWAEVNPQTGVLDVLNIHKWGSDVTGAERQAAIAARNVFLRAGRREATQSVQEVNNGSVNYLLRSEVGKTAFQFLSFPMASMEQQAGRLAVRAANGDALDVAKIITSAAGLGMMMYTARTHLNSLGRSDRKEYVKRNMAGDRFWTGALGQIGAASLFGYVYQVTTGVLDGQTRGLTPAVASWAVGGLSGGWDIAEAIAGNDLTENELRSFLRIFPTSSLYGARQILNATAALAD